MTRVSRVARRLAGGLMIVLISCVAFDLAAWWLAPTELNYHFPGYRFAPYAQRGSSFGWHYPRYFFEAHPSRGFDIRPGASGTAFAWAPLEFSVEANSLGCRDREFAALERPFVYAGGDSQTTGYVGREQRWTDLLQEKLGVRVLNCGVSGTGQRHQREKFLDIVAATGVVPEVAIVGYVNNDVDDDHEFPSNTVVEGYPVGTDKAIEDPVGLAAYVRDAQYRLDHPSLGTRIKWFLKEHSLIANMIYRITSNRRPPNSRSSDVYAYDDEIAAANRDALRAFAATVCGAGSRFALVLLPHAPSMRQPEYYQQVRAFLDANHIYYFDLHRQFADEGATAHQVAHPTDPHLSIEGNARVADAIAARMAEDGPRFGACAG